MNKKFIVEVNDEERVNIKEESVYRHKYIVNNESLEYAGAWLKQNTTDKDVIQVGGMWSYENGSLRKEESPFVKHDYIDKIIQGQTLLNIICAGLGIPPHCVSVTLDRNITETPVADQPIWKEGISVQPT